MQAPEDFRVVDVYVQSRFSSRYRLYSFIECGGSMSASVPTKRMLCSAMMTSMEPHVELLSVYRWIRGRSGIVVISLVFRT